MRLSGILLEAIVYILILLSPIPYASVDEPYKSLIIVTVSSALLLSFIRIFFLNKINLIFPSATLLLLFIMLSFLLTTLFSPRPSTGMASYLFFITPIIFFFVVINCFDSSDKLKRLVAVLVLSAMLFTIYSAATIFSEGIHPGDKLRAIFTSTFFNHNHFAGMLEMTIPFVLCGAIFYRTPRKNLRIIMGIFAAILSASLLLTISRGAFISFALTFLLINMVYFKNIKTLLPFAGLSGTLIYLTISLKPILEQWFEFDRISSSLTDRWSLYKSSLLGMMDRPLAGWGAGNLSAAYLKHREGIEGIVLYSHNDYIQALVEMGIPLGLSLLTLSFWLLVKGIIEIKKRHNPYLYFTGIAATMSIISIGFHSFVDFNLMIPSNSLYFAVVFGVFILSTTLEKKGRANFLLLRSFDVSKPDRKYLLLAGFSVCLFLTVVSLLLFFNQLNYKKAIKFYRMGEWDSAINLLQEIKSMPFNLPEYYNLLCRVLMTTGSLKQDKNLIYEAKENCIKAVELDRFNPFYATDAAFSYEHLGEREEAKKFYSLASEIDPQNLYFKFNLAEYMLRIGEDGEAENLYINMINKNPARLNLVLNHAISKRDLFKNIINHLSSQGGLVEEILKYLATHDLREEYLEIFYNSQKNKAKIPTQFYIYSARFLASKNSIDKATEILVDAIKSYPDDPSARLELIRVLLYKGDYNGIISVISDFPGWQASDEFLYYNATAHLGLGQYLDALKYAKLAHSKDVNSGRYRKLLYDIYIRMGLEYEAMNSLGDPRKFGRDEVGFMMLRASLYEKWGDNLNALREYRRVLSFEPQNRSALRKVLQFENSNLKN